jgi:hypothetical protein
VIIRINGEFVDCRWTDDDQLVIVDMHNRERLCIWWDQRHAISRPAKLLRLFDLLASRVVTGRLEPVNMDGSAAQ